MKELLNIIKDAHGWNYLGDYDTLIEDVALYERPYLIEHDEITGNFSLYRAKRSWGDICNDAQVIKSLNDMHDDNVYSWYGIYIDPNLNTQELQYIGELSWKDGK